jgi:hypothetical protein
LANRLQIFLQIVKFDADPDLNSGSAAEKLKLNASTGIK